jgi:hypothetical protein
MRPALVAGLVLALAPAAALAQSGPYLAVVSDEQVKLRAGPSDRFPDTGTLARGARVVVEREADNGWLEVAAPAGSVSWVHATFISGYDERRPLPQNVVVTSEGEVTLAAGKADLAQPLEIRKAKIPDGTILTVIGTKVQHDGKWWYPVAPPPGDVRYLPKSAVQPERPVNTSFVVRGNDSVVPAGSTGGASPPAVGPVAAIAGPGGAAVPPKPIVSHPLWAQAEGLEREGKLDDAEKVYFQLARQMNEPGGDHDIANLCYTRIHALREKKRLAAPSGGSGANTTGTLLPPVVKDDRVTARPASGTDRPPAPDRNPPPPAADPNRPQWAGPGTLVRSALAIDGRRTYSLESSPGVTRVYVVPAKDVDLERYVNRRVDVYGITYTRRELSKPYVVVTQVEPNP